MILLSQQRVCSRISIHPTKLSLTSEMPRIFLHAPLSFFKIFIGKLTLLKFFFEPCLLWECEKNGLVKWPPKRWTGLRISGDINVRRNGFPKCAHLLPRPWRARSWGSPRWGWCRHVTKRRSAKKIRMFVNVILIWIIMLVIRVTCSAVW